jgi:hypothetical protein
MIKSLKLNNRINIIAIISLALFFSCQKKPEDEINIVNGDYQNGLFVMCEGLYGNNNSALDFFSWKDSVIHKDAFAYVNKQGLGETANDMIVVGNRIFIAINGSACVMVINKNTCLIDKIIPILNNNNQNRQPRHIVYYDNNVYVSCFDGNVVKISTDDLSIKDVVSTGGRNPEGMAENNGKLYVANSGGLSFPNYDNSVSVIDLNSFSLVKKISVHSNPTVVKSYKDNVYFLSFGDYTKTPVMTRISTDNNIIDSTAKEITDFEFLNDKMYYFYLNRKTNQFSINYLNVNNFNSSSTSFTSNIQNMVLPYHINIIDNTIFITDAKYYTTSGQVFAFNLNGVLLYSFSTSINPSKIIKI